MDKYTFLNDQEKELIESFYKNEVQREAVRKVILAGIYQNGTLQPGKVADPATNFLLSLAFRQEITNEQLGAQLKASAEAIRIVEVSFDELKKFEKLVVSKEETNPAR